MALMACFVSQYDGLGRYSAGVIAYSGSQDWHLPPCHWRAHLLCMEYGSWVQKLINWTWDACACFSVACCATWLSPSFTTGHLPFASLQYCCSLSRIGAEAAAFTRLQTP